MVDIEQEKIFFTGKQFVEIEKKKNPGRVLDIGGGGEAVISQIYGDRVVAIDIDRNELEEAPANEALKIVMDARNMEFLKNQFEMVTSFFTLMYLENDDIGKVFAEVKRVLKPNRSFVIWDLNIPPRQKQKEEVYAAKVEVDFNDTSLETGYGVRWQDNEQDMDLFINLAKDNNFSVLEKKQKEKYFYLEIRNNK